MFGLGVFVGLGEAFVFGLGLFVGLGGGGFLWLAWGFRGFGVGLSWVWLGLFVGLARAFCGFG